MRLRTQNAGGGTTASEAAYTLRLARKVLERWSTTTTNDGRGTRTNDDDNHVNNCDGVVLHCCCTTTAGLLPGGKRAVYVVLIVSLARVVLASSYANESPVYGIGSKGYSMPSGVRPRVET